MQTIPKIVPLATSVPGVNALEYTGKIDEFREQKQDLTLSQCPTRFKVPETMMKNIRDAKNTDQSICIAIDPITSDILRITVEQK